MNPQDVHHNLTTDLVFFAEHAPLLIKGKAGGGALAEEGEEGALIPLRFNRAQRYIHARLEEQRRKTGGWVRAVLLKGRQQGGSTYVAARYYHRARSTPGTSVFILSHEGKTTDKLFGIVERFQQHVHPALRPEVGESNAKQITFPKLGSDYTVGTAGNENVGRGGTAQFFHGSEAAFWEHDYAIQDGALESIALAPGTEIILESTANGPKGLFYDKARDAIAGVGDYILVFVPWFWQDEYERDVPSDFVLDEEEELFVKTYFSKPLIFEAAPPSPLQCLRKLAWRRSKIIEKAEGGNLEVGKAKFRRDYPSNPVEAFQSAGIGLMRADAIMSARKSKIVDEVASLIAGVDPAGDSDKSDRTVIALRRGRHLEEIIKYPKMRPMELAGILAREVIDKRGAQMVFVDRGYGEGTIDRLQEMGYGRHVMGIAFNERPLNPDIYLNKRSEIIIEFARWLNADDVRIPDDDDVHAALACVPLDKETSNGLKYLPSKQEIKRALGGALLLDIVDAAALTFSYPVRRDVGPNGDGRIRKVDGRDSAGGKRNGGPLRSLSRVRERRTR